jgi:hypothetical protein
VSTAENYLGPGRGAAHLELERRYQRVLRLYPREFRTRQESEMLGVLMAGAADGQRRPGRADVTDIVRGALIVRLRGPRDGWVSALAVFSLLAPLFLVATDVLQVAFPYRVNIAGIMAAIHQPFREVVILSKGRGEVIMFRRDLHPQVGGVQLLSQHGFLLLLAGHVVIAALVLAGLRRTALTALVVVAAVDLTQWAGFGIPILMPYSVQIVTITVFLLEAVALAVSPGPQAGRHLVRWRYGVPVVLLAASMQACTLMADANRLSAFGRTGLSPGSYLVLAIAFAVTGLMVTLAFGVGWRACLLLSVTCYPALVYTVVNYAAFGFTSAGVTYDPVKDLTNYSGAPQFAALHLAALYLPPLLVAWWAAARAVRAQPTGQVATGPDGAGLT